MLQQSSHLLRLKRARSRSIRLGLQHESQASQQEVVQQLGAGVVQHFGAGAQVVQVLQQSSHLLRLKRARSRSIRLGLLHESQQLLQVLQLAVAQPLLQPATGAATWWAAGGGGAAGAASAPASQAVVTSKKAAFTSFPPYG